MHRFFPESFGKESGDLEDELTNLPSRNLLCDFSLNFSSGLIVSAT